MYSLRNVITVSWFLYLHVSTTGNRLFSLPAISIHGVDGNFSLCKFPVKSSWITSPGVFGGSVSVFFSVWGFCIFRFLPALRQTEQVFHFFSMSSRIFGHQIIAASLHVLLIPRWPRRRALSAAYRRVFGIRMRSSPLMIPQSEHFCHSFVVVSYLANVFVLNAAVQFDRLRISRRLSKK